MGGDGSDGDGGCICVDGYGGKEEDHSGSQERGERTRLVSLSPSLRNSTLQRLLPAFPARLAGWESGGVGVGGGCCVCECPDGVEGGSLLSGSLAELTASAVAAPLAVRGGSSCC
jgi:hypothetical protein